MTVSVRVRDLDCLQQHIREYVSRHGSARHLADACAMSSALLSMLRNGRHCHIGLDLAGRIEDELGTERGALFAVVSTSDVYPYLDLPAGDSAGDAGRRHPDYRRPA